MSHPDALDQPSNVLTFWGKARGDAGEEAIEYHPVAFHSLDVAACLKRILEIRPITLARGARLLGIPAPAAARGCSLLIVSLRLRAESCVLRLRVVVSTR
jgi:hypothetical protein